MLSSINTLPEHHVDSNKQENTTSLPTCLIHPLAFYEWYSVQNAFSRTNCF